MRVRSSISEEHFGLTEAPQRMRKKPRFSYGQAYTGISSATKLRGCRRTESMLERDLLTLLEADPAIECFAMEPHSLIYFIAGDKGENERRSYTPDVVARTTRGTVVVLDAKAAALRARPRWQKNEPAIREAYQLDHGVRFLVLTEAELRAEPRLTNSKVIVSRARGASDPKLRFRIEEVVGEAPASLSKLCRVLHWPRSSIYAATMALVKAGTLRFDLSVPLSDETMFSAGARS